MPSSDVVLVGGGMACLVAAARLVRDGHRVVLLEQTDQVGGYFGGFVNDAGDRFDLAVSHLLGGTPGARFAELVQALGLDVELEPVDVADVVTLRGRRYVLPTGLDALETELAAAFPDAREELGTFLGAMRTFMGGDSGSFMMQNYRRYFEEYCRQTISDADLRSLLAMRIQCDDSSFLVMAGFFTECYGRGMVYPRGGVTRLVAQLRHYVESAGGQIRLGSRVEDLELTDGGAASAVVLADGTTVPCDAVLYGGSVQHLDTILTRHGVPGLDVAGRKVGHSSLSIFLTLDGVDLSRFAGPARHYLTDTTDVFATYRTLETGRLPDEPVIKLHFMSRIDQTLAAAGRDLVRIEVDMFHHGTGHGPRFYADYADEVVRRVTDALLPELATHTVYRRDVSPIDYERWFGHEGGSATGWAHDVENLMTRRFQQRTAVPNLFITGQWGEHGSGLPQLLASAEKSLSLTHRWLGRRVTS